MVGLKTSKKQDVLEVLLPPTITLSSLYSIIGALFHGLRKRPQKVALDFQNLASIQVGGIAVLSNMIEFCRKSKIQTEFVNYASCRAAPFLECSGFSELYLGGSHAPIAARREFLPLKLVEYNRSYPYVNHELVPWLSQILAVEARGLASLKVCFEEIFNNIKDHSTVDIGCSSAHYDQAKHKITICISDFGVGIPRKVRRQSKVDSDEEAIGLACQEGFTTKSTPRNMGAGLHVLIRNVTKNSGSVIIYSGKGIYSCLLDPRTGTVKRQGSPAQHGGLYPGTMIYLTLDTEKFVPSEIDEEEFVWE